MDFLRPATWDEALAAKAELPGALPVQGGTDVMVEINFAARRPEALLDLTRIGALADWDTVDGRLRVGAGVTYARLIAELGGRLPGLAQASRTVGSPQIRNRGTVGGNLGAASPAGDGHPPLLAGDAVVEAESAARGVRMIPAAEFFTGVKRNALAPDELIRAFWTAPASGPQYFAKIGTRNAMVIAVCSFAIALHPAERRVGTGLGSAAPTPRRAPEAEEFIAAELDWDGRGPLSEPARRRFGELVAAASAPIDDVRGTGAYRAHALAVLARRTLAWAWNDHRKEARRCA
ncbi:FAD binding domain-containing protein [Actinomadura chibensis]|uniref:Xanthine dehydrogenase family protein subunit M n=1 Tax=Actinomadura chibensis TaxID=392828 RepID=A0A5D0NQE0_9ACTN|nr:FAD binding domain-containing protein [Actinomadura chibensis]TYB46873.1 xanthine dehydrogenase family protein subunit M [Actinomadura chibensis]